MPDVKFEYDSNDVPIFVVRERLFVLGVVTFPEDELYIVGFVGADDRLLVELLDTDVHNDSDEDVVYVPNVLVAIVVDEWISRDDAILKTVTSSVTFPDEAEGVDTDVILVLVPSVLLIWLVEGNGEIVDSLEYNDLV